MLSKILSSEMVAGWLIGNSGLARGTGIAYITADGGCGTSGGVATRVEGGMDGVGFVTDAETYPAPSRNAVLMATISITVRILTGQELAAAG